jgi:hypothetical protein
MVGASGDGFDSVSEKPFLHLWYCGGTIWSQVFSSVGSAFTANCVEVEAFLSASPSILAMNISSPGSAVDTASSVHAFAMRATSLSILSPKVLMTMGCMSSAIVASFQFVFGWKAASQGYPSTISSSPQIGDQELHILDLGSDPHLQVHKVLDCAILVVCSIYIPDGLRFLKTELSDLHPLQEFFTDKVVGRS